MMGLQPQRSAGLSLGLGAAEDAPPNFGEVIMAIGGRFIETLGVIKGDDRLIEQGKSRAAEAIDTEEAGDEAKPS